MKETLGTVVSRIDERTARMAADFKNMYQWQISQDRRLNKLENFRGWLIGVGAALVAIAGVLVKILP